MSSRRAVVVTTLVALCVLAGGVALAVPARFGDVFDRGSGSLGPPWTNSSGWAIDKGRAKLTSNGTREAVVNTGLRNRYRVAVDISFGPNRANAGLATLWKNHSNHLYCKIEVTPRNPRGLMSIGHQLHGRNVSLLKSAKRFGLRTGRTYRLSITKHGRTIDCTVTGSGINGGSKTITYTLNSAEVASFGSATRSGLRGRNLHDEDDGRTRYDKFIVRAI